MANAKAAGLALFDEASFVASSIRTRGLKHFARALGIAAGFIFFSHKLVFESGRQKLLVIERRLGTERATARFADTYKELDDNLRIFSQRLPPATQTEAWLLDSVRESMRAEGLTALSISPVAVTEQKDFRSLTIQLTFNAKFGEVASWVARMEGSRQLLHVSALHITKGGDRIGENNVQATISTLAPKRGAQ